MDLAVFRCCLRFAVLVLGSWAIAVPVSLAQPPDDTSLTAADRQARIAELIEQLGDEQYATREKAQAALERMGLQAFDALHEAQYSDDIEIAHRARYLVASMQFSWSHESDPPEVKRILRRYGEQDHGGRETRLTRLATLADGLGVAAPCRLARFEVDDSLSKRAALLVMHREPPVDESQRNQLVATIEQTVAGGKRPAARWLQAFARTLREPERTLPTWQQLAHAEQQTFAQFPEKTSRAITVDLLRWQAELLRNCDREEESLEAIRRSISLLDGTREQLVDMVDWLIDRHAWMLVDEVAERYSDQFADDGLLLYRMAEAQLRQGKKDRAEQTAARAYKLVADKPQRHIEAAIALQERGLIEWSEREYRYVMLLGPRGSSNDLYSRFLLSEMLHDQQQSESAAEVLQGAVTAMDSDPNVMKLVQHLFRREPGGVRSRMHYFYSLKFAAEGNRAKQLEHLKKGIRSDPHDADVLIAMYRVADADESWRAETLAGIETAAEHFRKRRAQFQELADNPPDEPQGMEARRLLASANNQFAWLIGNTEGNYEEALQCSLKSLELSPDNPGYLDTLGRCYFAKGDFVNAVKRQARAVELEPHSGQIRRQLTLFENALAESQASAPNGDAEEEASGADNDSSN